MYYDISPEYLATIHDKATKRRLKGTINSVDFTGSDVVRGSFEVSNRCAEESDMKIGGVYIGQLNMTFVPSFVNKIAKKSYVGAVITPTIGLYVPETHEWEDVPVGVFTIQSANISKEGISVEAYDNMVKFDKGFPNLATYGKIYDLLNFICTECGVELGVTRSEVEALPNGTEELYVVEQNDIETYRDLLYWVAQTCACFATINRDGKLEVRPFTGLGTTELDETHRDVDAVYSDYVTKWTSISMVDNDSGETQYYSLPTDDGLCMNLGANPLLQTVADFDTQEAIAYLEGLIDDLDDKIGLISDEIEVLEQLLENVEAQLVDHPDDPALLAEKARLEAEIADKNGKIHDYQAEQERLQKEIDDLEQGIIDRSKIFKERARKRILNAVAQIHFTPFTVTSARDPIFDLGDQIVFTGGMADEEIGCIMCYSYKIDSFSFEGYGDNPALTDSRSKTDKSVTAASKQKDDKAEQVQFVQFINAAPISVTKGQTLDLGRLSFQVSKTSDVQAWIELKTKTALTQDNKAGMQISYFLDGEEITYHPVEEWDLGNAIEFELHDTTLWILTDESRDEETTHTINLQFLIRNVNPKTIHTWRVKVTGLNGVEVFDTGCIHIVLWTQGMAQEGEWIGLIQARDVFPVYPIKGFDLFGEIEDDVTISFESDLITEDGDFLTDEAGDIITTENILDLPSASTLTGSEYIPIVQDGETVKATAQDVADCEGE